MFELVNFLDDRSKQSVTSGECQWKRRARETEPPILVTDLDTSMESNFNKVVEKPIEDNYNPISDLIGRPNIETFIECLKRDHPEACLLDTIEPRPKPVKKQKILQFNIPTPIDKAKKFFLSHADCGKCSDECLLSYQVNLEYSKEELKKIELGTRGQSENENWYKMRRGLLTASKFKEILHSRNQDITATNLLKDSGINENALPESIAYGRKNESKAREMYARNHKYQQKKSVLIVPGLVISQSNCFLAASPDGLIKCEICGDFLIEIKCFSKYRGFHPRNALLMSQVCTKKDNGELVVDKKHKYYYQMQGQMLCTGIFYCVLVAYTNKGIEAVNVPFDAEFCQVIEPKLSRFYVDVFYSTLKDNMLQQHVVNPDTN